MLKTPTLYVAAVVLGAGGGLFLAPAIASSSENLGEGTVEIAKDPEDASDDKRAAADHPGSMRSPSPKDAVTAPPYPVNANGMTYGSGAYVDERNPGPELILAYGLDGNFGYVRADEFPATAPAPRSLEEAAASVPDASYTIPLYDADGVTIIDRFPIDAGPASAE